MAKLGTLQWVEQTHGRLGLRDKLALVAQGVKAKAATRKRMAANVKFRHREVDDILPPDSAIAREAMAMCEAASAPFLFNHSLRAYFWARLLDDGSKPFDDEAVFTAIMLHDMGLTDSHRLKGTDDQCFTLVGAQMAEELGARHNWDGHRCALAANAITLHLNVIVDPAHGKEAEMVRAGSGGDVAGLGLDVLHKDQIDHVCARHPRLGFKSEILPVLAIEEHARPACRIAFMNAKLGFAGLVVNAPMFSE
jgi:HD domain